MPIQLILLIIAISIITLYLLYKKKILDVIEEERNHRKISKEPEMKPHKK